MCAAGVYACVRVQVTVKIKGGRGGEGNWQGAGKAKGAFTFMVVMSTDAACRAHTLDHRMGRDARTTPTSAAL